MDMDISMDISMDIHGKSVDMDINMDGKFHIHGKLGHCRQPLSMLATSKLSIRGKSKHFQH